MNIEPEVPKHKKKKNSTKSISSKKSNHKHNYKRCLLVTSDDAQSADYCTICGKINNIKLFETERIEGSNFLKLLSREETIEKYKDLETKYVESIWSTQYVSIEEEDQ